MGHFEWYTSISQLPRIANLLSTTYLYICTYMFIILNLYTYYSACYIGTIFVYFLVQWFFFFLFLSTHYIPPPFYIIFTYTSASLTLYTRIIVHRVMRTLHKNLYPVKISNRVYSTTCPLSDTQLALWAVKENSVLLTWQI